MNLFNPHETALQKTIYLERYVNNGSPSGFTDKNNTSIGTRAQDSNDYFWLPLVAFEDDAISFEMGINNCFSKRILPVHPDMLDYVLEKSNAKQIDKIEAIPFSSGRTVYIPEWNLFIKLQYNQLLGRIKRTIESKNILHALAVNDIFSKHISTIPEFSYYPEYYGKAMQLQNGETFGMLLRSFTPAPNVYDSAIHIPGFSLFSKDTNNPQDATILSQLVVSKDDKQQYILNHIILPVISIYFELLIKYGLQIEAHAQNICFLYDGEIRGIAIRDFESVDKDLGIAHSFNSYFDLHYKCFSPEREDYNKRHSFMFDFKLCEYLIMPIIEQSVLLGCNEEQMVDCIKTHVQQFLLQLPKGFFPENLWYAFPNTLIDRTSERRPYIENAKPIFR